MRRPVPIVDLATRLLPGYFWILVFAGWASVLPAQLPVVTVRFANPQAFCGAQEYCLDVEFLSSIPGVILYAMNVRFIYDDDMFEFVDFRNFEAGYSPVLPYPPLIVTHPEWGPEWFNFNGPAEFINGAIKLTDPTAPQVELGPDEWTKLFQVCLALNNYDIELLDTFCEPVIWDLEVDPSNGGYLQGSGGVVITVTTSSGEGSPSTENVVQFNWEYTGNGETPPYGQPVEEICSNINCLLPVTLLSFTGKVTATGHRLEWQTEGEFNLEGFFVETSDRQFLWKEIGFVPAASNGPGRTRYSFLYRDPGKEDRYYRLILKDQDGRLSYSHIIFLPEDPDGDEPAFSVYPNPLRNEMLHIVFSDAPAPGTILRLFDELGRLRFEMPASGIITQMDLQGIAGGVYFVSAISGTDNIYKKIIIY